MADLRKELEDIEFERKAKDKVEVLVLSPTVLVGCMKQGNHPPWMLRMVGAM